MLLCSYTDDLSGGALGREEFVTTLGSRLLFFLKTDKYINYAEKLYVTKIVDYYYYYYTAEMMWVLRCKYKCLTINFPTDYVKPCSWCFPPVSPAKCTFLRGCDCDELDRRQRKF